MQRSRDLTLSLSGRIAEIVTLARFYAEIVIVYANVAIMAMIVIGSSLSMHSSSPSVSTSSPCTHRYTLRPLSLVQPSLVPNLD